MLNRIVGNVMAAGVVQSLTAPEKEANNETMTLTSDMHEVGAPFNKYSSMIDTHSSIKPKRTETLYEQVFGKDTTEFDMLKDSFLAR